MSILVAIILGGIVGWIATRLMGRDYGMLGSIAIGIVGAFIGSVIANLIGSSAEGYLAFSWSGLLWSLFGAIIFVAILGMFQGKSHHA